MIRTEVTGAKKFPREPVLKICPTIGAARSVVPARRCLNALAEIVLLRQGKFDQTIESRQKEMTIMEEDFIIFNQLTKGVKYEHQ